MCCPLNRHTVGRATSQCGITFTHGLNNQRQKMLHTVKLVGNSDLGIERSKKEGFDENLESEKKNTISPQS